MFKTKSMGHCLLCVAMLASGAAAYAQENVDQPLDLGVIVISGTGLPTSVLNNPASVSVVGGETIARVPPTSVARILNEVPGLRVTESGIERIRIRGESSQRVAILIDGQKLSDHTTYGTPILVDPGSIERIEVVRGPSSVVSGNRAIGGVINIITKRGGDKPVEVTLGTGYFSGNKGYRHTLGLAGARGGFDYRLGFSKSGLGDRRTPGGTLAPSGSEDRSLNAHLGYSFGNHYVGVRVQDYDLSADVYTGSPAFMISLPKRDLRKYNLFYEGTDLTPWMSSLKLDAFSQTIDRQFRNNVSFAAGPAQMSVVSTSDDKQETSGVSLQAKFEFAPGHRTVIGLEYEDDRLRTSKSTTRTTTMPFGPPPPPNTTLRYADAYIKTASIFAQHEIEFNNRLTGTFGARYYRVESELTQFAVNGAAQPRANNSDRRWLGSAGLVYALGDDTTLRANISQGYTYPTLSQLFLTSTGGGGVTLGNPALRPETSTVYEIGARLDRGMAVLDATLFYSESKDYISSIATGVPRTSQYQNVNSVKSWGAELSAEFDPRGDRSLRPYVTAAYVNREFKYANGFTTSDSGTPSLTATLGLRGDWQGLGALAGTWDVFLRGESSAKLRSNTGVVLDETDGFTTLNLRATAELTENVGLSFEANNVLDKSYRSINQIDGPGRNFSLFLTATF